MKKTLVALAALAATGVFAQSTVSITGIADVGLAYGSNVAPGAANWSLGAANNNRIIFSGSEDLGGGMRATFAAQMRYTPTTGAAEGAPVGVVGVAAVPGLVNVGRPLFQGETRVGLVTSMGTIQLGRGLTALQAPNGGYIDPWGVSTVAGSVYAPGYATDYIAGGEGRTDGIFYTSPNMSGLQLGLTYSPRTIVTGGAAPTQTFSKSFFSIAATYANGPIAVLLGTEQNRQGDTLTNLGGNYNFGAAKVYVGFGLVKGGAAIDRVGSAYAATASNLPGCTTGAGLRNGTGVVAAPGVTAGSSCMVSVNETINSWAIGAAIPMGAATIRVGYSNWGSDVAGLSRDTKLGLGVNYALSKRTSIYSDLASTSRNNNAATGNPANDNSNVTAFDLGILHTF